MPNAVIVDAVRTPVGRRNGVFKDYHPVDLASRPLEALVERNGIDPALIDDVIMGTVSQTGEQAYNVGRNAALAAGYPEEVPGVTIDRQCGSSQQSAHFAAQAIMAGVQDVVVAAGVENMTRVPMGITAHQGPGLPSSSNVGALLTRTRAPGAVRRDDRREMGYLPAGLDELSSSLIEGQPGPLPRVGSKSRSSQLALPAMTGGCGRSPETRGYVKTRLSRSWPLFSLRSRPTASSPPATPLRYRMVLRRCWSCPRTRPRR